MDKYGCENSWRKEIIRELAGKIVNDIAVACKILEGVMELLSVLCAFRPEERRFLNSEIKVTLPDGRRVGFFDAIYSAFTAIGKLLNNAAQGVIELKAEEFCEPPPWFPEAIQDEDIT